MRYGEELIEEVRERSDIVDVISSYVSLKKKGTAYFGLCPFHNEKSPSFCVNREKQMYYCFGCGQGGDVYSFLMEYNRLSFTEAVQELAGRAGMELPEEELTNEEKKQQDERTVLKEMNKTAAVYFHWQLLHSKRGEKAREYLSGRGISQEMIKRFGIGYADIYRDDLYQYLRSKGFTDMQMKDSSLVNIDSVKGSYDKFFNRVMFPIMDVGQHVIGFGGRVMGEGEPKYLNSKETILFDKGRNLYGLNYAKRSRENAIILCEGYMDVISLHQAGFTNAVAPLGTAFTSGQAMLLKRYAKEVILSFDSDGAGIKAALRALPILRENGLRGKVVSMKPYKDPDELMKAEGREGFEKRLREAESGRMFELRILHDEYDQNDPESRTEFIRAMAKKLAEIEEVMERTTYVHAAANQFMVNEKDLLDLVNRYGLNIAYENANKEYKKEPVNRDKAEQIKKEKQAEPQKLLLTWLIERPEIYASIKKIIGPDDFLIPLHHAVALMVFEQLEKGEEIQPARILNKFMDGEERKEVAGLFHTRLPFEPDQEKNEKALIDVVRKVKSASIEEEMSHTNDIVRWQELIAQKNRLQKLTSL